MYLNERLIQEVENHPLLYDFSLPGHKETELRNLTWKEIARNISPDDYSEETVDKLRLRWRSLRDNYVKSCSKMQKNEHTRPYKYLHLLEFLAPYVKTGNRSSKETKVKSERKPIAFCNVTMREETDPFTERSDADESSNCSTSTVRARKRHAQQQPVVNNRPQSADGSAEECGGSDVDDFFMSMARTVKKLRPLTIAKIKKHIANIVMDSEIEDLQA